MANVQLERMGMRIRDKKQEMTFPTSVKELHKESESKVICVSQAITLPHYVKFFALSVIKYASEDGKTSTFFMNQAIISFYEALGYGSKLFRKGQLCK